MRTLPPFTGPVEPYPPYTPPSRCEAREPWGVATFRDWVLDTFGGEDGGIARECTGAPSSPHHESRAWDWIPPSRACAEELIALLLASEGAEQHAGARRAGIHNLIYWERIWSASRVQRFGGDGWGDYRHGPDANDTLAHRDHVHFEFSPKGAEGATSFFAGFDRPTQPGSERPPAQLNGTQTIVPASATPVTPEVLQAALGNAHVAKFGEAPSPHRLKWAWAMVQHETASTEKMWNHNVGNIACTPNWPVCHRLRVRDPSSEPVKYRSYLSLDEGARDWWRLMNDRYDSALAHFDADDPEAAARSLRSRGYMGQAADVYARGMRLHGAVYDRIFGAPPSGGPGGLVVASLFVLAAVGAAYMGSD